MQIAGLVLPDLTVINERINLLVASREWHKEQAEALQREITRLIGVKCAIEDDGVRPVRRK